MPAIVDPSAAGLWQERLPYDAPFGLMDVVLRAGEITDVSQVGDPEPNAKSIRAGDVLGIGTITAGGRPGDRVEARLLPPTDTISAPDAGLISNEGEYRSYGMTSFYWNHIMQGPAGQWTLQVLLNGESVKDVPFSVQ